MQLLLAFVRRYPELQKLADDRVESFIESERNRGKKACPNLGP